MLQFIRDHATGWIAWGIVLLISVPFALWGIYDYLGPNPNIAVATVNGTDIDNRQYQQAYQRQRAQLQAMFGVDANSPLLNQDRLRSQIINNLIDDEVVLQTGNNDGMRVSDSQLAYAIQSREAFRVAGMFSQDQYELWLQRQGFSPGGFEFDMRRSLLNEQIVVGLARTPIVTERDRTETARIAQQTRSFSQLLLTEAPDGGPAVEEPAITAYFESNKSRFKTAEEVQVAYIEISRDAIARNLVADESELRALYEQQKLNYSSAARREARHILIQLAPDADEAQAEAARALIDSLREQLLLGGADFAELAKEHSEDPGSAAKGGALGYFGRDIMAPPFEEAAFDLALGKISEPVRTKFGWHLIEVTDIEESHVQTFDEARPAVLKEFQRRAADQEFAEQVEQLANLTFEHPESLDVAAEALGLDVRTSDFFGREGGKTLGVSDELAVVEAAFEDEVLIEGNNSQVVELGSRVLSLRVSEYRPSRAQALDEVRETVTAELKKLAANERGTAKGRAIVQQLRNGADVEEIAASEGLVWSESDDVSRPTDETDNAISTVFRMPKPDSVRPVFDGIALGDGTFAVLALRAVKEGVAPEQTEAGNSSPEQRLAATLGFAEFNAFVRGLRKSAEVTIPEGQL